MITGASDKNFAAGGDLHELAAMRTESEAREFADETKANLDAVREFPVPVLAALNGDALGGGSELALACDFRLAAAGVSIGFLQGRIAVGTGWGGGIDLMDVVGRSRALRLLARAETVDGTEALDIDLLDAVAADGQDLDDLVAEFLEPLLALTRPVLVAFKALSIGRRRGLGREELERLETELFGDLWVRDEHWQALEKVLPKKG